MKAFFKYIFLCAAAAGVLSSCDKDDNKTVELTLAESAVQLYEGATAEVAITTGNDLYTVKSSQPSVVSATVAGNKVTLKAEHFGRTEVTVKDQAGKTATLTVTVAGYFGIDLSAYNVEDFEGERTASVSILDGNGDYTAASADDAIATAAVKDNTVTITMHAPGETIVTVSDKGGKKAEIEVTSVEIVELIVWEEPEVTIEGFGRRKQIVFEQGNGGYTAVSSDESVVVPMYINDFSMMLDPVNTGTATVTVTDQVGKTGTLKVMVKYKAFTVNNPAVTVVMTKTAQVSLNGNGDYSLVSNSNESVATAVISGTSLKITSVAPGMTTLTVKDRSGATATVVVTVPVPSTL